MKCIENLYLRTEVVRWGFNGEGRVPKGGRQPITCTYIKIFFVSTQYLYARSTLRGPSDNGPMSKLTIIPEKARGWIGPQASSEPSGGEACAPSWSGALSSAASASSGGEVCASFWEESGEDSGVNPSITTMQNVKARPLFMVNVHSPGAPATDHDTPSGNLC